ncbi:Dihydroxy-acid/6-phosphogluconate dehydratase [Elaphomyces granulatus]
MQPAGKFLGEEFFRAGGVPAVIAELLSAGKLYANVLTCNGLTMRDNFNGKHSWNRQVIQGYRDPILENAGFRHLQGSLFNSAIMKTCVIDITYVQEISREPQRPKHI